MKYFFITGLLLSLSLLVKSQVMENGKPSFADTVRKYFDYDKLSQVQCADVPPGIYALSFRIDKFHVPYDFQFSADSLEKLKALFINAITASADKVPLKKSKKRYLQFCYFNILLWCNSFGDTTKLSDNIYSDVSKLLSAQLSAIEGSFKTSIKGTAEYQVLEIVNINDYNPNYKRDGPGFRNDIKPSSITNEEMEKLIQDIKAKKIKIKAEDLKH